MLIKNLPADKEVAYRVLFIPQQNEFGEEQLRGAKFTKGSLTLKVATGVGMLVFAQPKEPKQQLTVTRDEKGVRLVSEGNVHVLISDGVVCPSSVSLNEEEQSKAWSSRDNSEIVAKGCAGFRGGRIHSGRTKEIAAALGSTVYVAKRDDSTGNFNRIEIPQEAKP
jgi:P pilus assembly chaperone PapD